MNKINGFYKWLSSTKFQIAFLGLTGVYVAIPLFQLSPEIAVAKMVEIVGIYCGARVVEPVVEFAMKFIEAKRKEKSNASENQL